jgi:Skp family chaperone for outer membrane proteins
MYSFQKRVFLSGFFVGLASAHAMEIPVTRGSGHEGVSVGYVDMEKIYEEYPETHKAKKDFYTELAKRRRILADKEKEMADLRERLSVLRSSLEEVDGSSTSVVSSSKTVAVSSAPVITPEVLEATRSSLVQQEQLLKEHEVELEKDRQDALEEFKQLEERKALQVLGKLYKALVQLAEEKGIDLVVDKSSILYGQHAFDLTEKLSRRVRGLPDDDSHLVK